MACRGPSGLKGVISGIGLVLELMEYGVVPSGGMVHFLDGGSSSQIYLQYLLRTLLLGVRLTKQKFQRSTFSTMGLHESAMSSESRQCIFSRCQQMVHHCPLHGIVGDASYVFHLLFIFDVKVQ